LTLPFIDFHTHNQSQATGVISVLSHHAHVEKRDLFHTIGLHPWFEVTEPEKVFNRVRHHYLESPQCLGIGECGLDRIKGLPFNGQIDIFEKLVHIANEINAPVVIHCVRAFDIMLKIHKSSAKTPWAIHGFTRNKVLCKQLVDAGIYVSVSPGFKMSQTLIETIKWLPLDFLFIESDTDKSLKIDQRYSILASARGIEVDFLKHSIFNNFATFFKEKWRFQTG
jgi:TatD DNase family protein